MHWHYTMNVRKPDCCRSTATFPPVTGMGRPQSTGQASLGLCVMCLLQWWQADVLGSVNRLTISLEQPVAYGTDEKQGTLIFESKFILPAWIVWKHFRTNNT